MKRIIIILLISVLFVLPSFSQTMRMAESDSYRVYSDISEENAAFIATAMDEYFNLYNRYFHFDKANLDSKLQIRLFQSKDGFDNYLSSIIPETSSDLRWPSAMVRSKKSVNQANKDANQPTGISL